MTPTITTFRWGGQGRGAGTARRLGALLAIATLLCAAPPTAVLGAVLLIAYLGGTVAVARRPA